MSERVFETESSSYDRALGFFDAIYGFSLTLLIANLDVPPPDAWLSVNGLLSHGVGSQLLGFLISFVVIAAFWRRNHQLMDRLPQIDSGVINANIVATGLVIFIPFSTQGMSDPNTADYALPTALYAVNIAAAMMAQTAIMFVARRHHLVAHPVSGSELTIRAADAMVGPLVFFSSVPVAFIWGGNAAKYWWLLLILLGPLSARLAARSGVSTV